MKTLIVALGLALIFTTGLAETGKAQGVYHQG
jgi:hypothetical protein